MDGDARDHPRSRGVYPAQTATRLAPLGSSPLARGLQHVGVGPQHDPGIIPARAGFTRTGRPATARRWDHPRSRGVYVDDGGHLPVHPGIIPARAGFTERTTRTERGGGDHPRSRGVYMASDFLDEQWAGSSPLARGLRVQNMVVVALVGIIPARAGFTPSTQCGWRGASDHPRSRGVYRRVLVAAWGKDGSSPLARGLPPIPPSPAARTGIIPARAGFTWCRRPGRPTSWDHPRSRGVYAGHSSHPLPRVGSSPLARGLLLGAGDPRRAPGIIPARAGFTGARR